MLDMEHPCKEFGADHKPKYLRPRIKTAKFKGCLYTTRIQTSVKNDFIL